LLWCAISPTRRSVQDLVLGSVVIYEVHPDRGVRRKAGSPDTAATPGI
jgi:uncharacterized RDD family membrane protein YckC